MPGHSLQKPKLFKWFYFSWRLCICQAFLVLSAAVIASKARSMTASSTSSVIAHWMMECDVVLNVQITAVDLALHPVAQALDALDILVGSV